MAGYRNIDIEGKLWRKSLTLPAQLFLWSLPPYSSSHVRNSKGLGCHQAKCPSFQKFGLGWSNCRPPFKGASQLLGAMEAVQWDHTSKPTVHTIAGMCCKYSAVGNVARICFERSVLTCARNWPSCLIMGPSAGGRRGGENTFHPGEVLDKSISV